MLVTRNSPDHIFKGQSNPKFTPILPYHYDIVAQT